MASFDVDAFMDELVKIAIGLAPPGAPTVNSKGVGLGPKMPRLNPTASKPAGLGSMNASAGPTALPKTGF